MKSAEIRDAFLNYFASKGHSKVASSSLVPGNDPTLLFTNAGMVQFKDVFLGGEKRDYCRAVSSQRCVRAGGKHNDLENVGYTARHHTFFEMLGNFSFGDYFKQDAIKFAWEFLTEELKLPKERLWVTVHISDDEAADIWVNEIGVDPARLSRLDEDNFWQMGDTGPCGPSTEIFWDHGEHIAGGPPGSENDDLDRYIEIWNLVFMQYERDSSGEMTALPKPSIDTGMGLERVAAVMQGVHNNYDIDLFKHLISAAIKITQCKDPENASLKVLADHIRSCAFLVADGVQPSNEGRGYVLRRIIRRALRHGHKLGAKGVFFHNLVAPLGEVMGEAYPELIEKGELIAQAIKAEEEQFARTLDKGMGVLDSELKDLQGDILPGELIFLLYDTFGFPTDLTNDVARERGYTLDLEGYESCMDQQRARARSASQFDIDYTDSIRLEGSTDFSGYSTLEETGTIVGLYSEGQQIESASEGTTVAVVLDKTSFYAESGGQVGDTGYLICGDAKVEVLDCKKSSEHNLHIGTVLSGSINVGNKVIAQVDKNLRQSIALNHSATHLAHEALRQVLGEHVTQKGSLVDSEKLRFDFSHHQAVSSQQLRLVEQMVNREILRNTEVSTQLMSMDEAKEQGAMALFGEKYSDEVRVLSMGGDFSVELCGGTHVERTGDIGLIKITSESSVASGVRRIEAVTGQSALAYCEQTQDTVEEVAEIAKVAKAKVTEKIRQVMEDNRRMQKEIDQLNQKLANSSGSDIMSPAQQINGVTVLSTIVEGADAKSLKSVADQVRSKIEKGVFFLVAKEGDKASLVAGVTKNLTSDIKAGDLMKHVSSQLDGKGGGRPDMAMGAASDLTNLSQALESVATWVEDNLA
ncbi:MAG: Alanine--tRNA ligase [Cellvibrionales bacterium UBA7375]|nr:MAG: Alanine--tRNA ligase [Cellvibrionales bacterium UBA7375]